MHVTEPTRHFGNELVEPVPTMPVARDAAQGKIVGVSRAQSDVTDLDYSPFCDFDIGRDTLTR